jgi:hypothetical protein
MEWVVLMPSIIPNKTSLTSGVATSDTFIYLASVANINIGDLLLIDQEVLPTRAYPKVSILTGNLPGVFVTRTGRAATHGVGATVYTGPSSFFQTVDPVGVPPPGSQPYWINVKTGVIWVAQGDEAGPGALNRWWQPQSNIWAPTSAVSRDDLSQRAPIITPV